MRTCHTILILVAACLSFTAHAASLTPEQQQRAQEVVDRVNLYRKLHGVAAVTLDLNLSGACVSHASYIDQNRSADPYSEDSALPGFTSEGRAVAPATIFTTTLTGAAAIDFFFSRYAFRGFVLAPDFTIAGYGDSPGTNGGSAVAVLRVGDTHKPTGLESPKNGNKGQAATKAVLSLSDFGATVGLDIILYGSTSTSIAEVVSTSITAGGSPVAHTVSVQTTSASNADKKGDIILSPTGPLPAGSLISVVIDYKENGAAKHKEWSFTTSASGLFDPVEAAASAGSGGGGGPSKTEADSDADGFPDELESALGTLANDATSTPTGATAVAGTPTITKASVALNFAKPSSDSISLMGTLPVPDGFVVSGTQVTVDVGGVIKTFTLDEKGASPASTTESLKLKVKAVQGVISAQEAKFTLKCSKSDFVSTLSDESLSDTTIKGQAVNLPVVILFNGQLFKATHPLLYTAKAGKNGRAK
jgi:hypothetical protein